MTLFVKFTQTEKKNEWLNVEMLCVCVTGQLERAQEHYEVFYHLTMGRTWQDPSGRMHHSRSCEELQKVLTLLGQRLLQEQDYTHAIKMFNEAYQMAKECMHTPFTLTLI